MSNDKKTAEPQAEPQQPAGAHPSWQLIETAPKNRPLLLGYVNSHGHWRTVRGEWLTQEFIEEYAEDADCMKQGWYETSVEDDDGKCWSIKPSHWMPLPKSPDAALAAQGQEALHTAPAHHFDLSTSDGGRAYLAWFFEGQLRPRARHDFRCYINEELAADFACVLARHLDAAHPAPAAVPEPSSQRQEAAPRHDVELWRTAVPDWTERHGIQSILTWDQAKAAIEDALKTFAAQGQEGEPSAWMHEGDADRVVSAKTMEGARKDGGAILSSLKPYTVPLYALPPRAQADAPARGYALSATDARTVAIALERVAVIQAGNFMHSKPSNQAEWKIARKLWAFIKHGQQERDKADADKRDAERYRYLRNDAEPNRSGEKPWVTVRDKKGHAWSLGTVLDERIDAALSSKGDAT